MAISARKRARISELDAAGLSMRQIAAEVKVSPDTVSRYLAAATQPLGQSPIGLRRRPTTHVTPDADPGARSRIEQKRAELEEWELDREREAAIKDLLEQEREAREQPVFAMLQRWQREQEARRASNQAWDAQGRALEEQRELEERDLQISSDEAWERLAQARQAALLRRRQAVGLSADRPIEDLLAAEREAAVRNRIDVLNVLDRLL